MVLDEKEWRNLMINIMCDAMGCTNWDFEPNENGDKFIKKWTEVFKQRFSQQPPKEQADTCNCHIDDDDGNINYCEKHEPKERKVSLEEIKKVVRQQMDIYNAHYDNKCEQISKAILSLLNATEGQ